MPKPERHIATRIIVGAALVGGLGLLAAGFDNSAPVRPVPDPRPPREAVATPSPTVPTPAPPANQPRALPGIRLVATPQSDGTFEVVETITVRKPTDRLVLAAPTPAGTGANFAAFRPHADTIQVRVGGQPVPMRPAEVGEQRVILLRSPADRIELRYRLTGAIIRSVPSRPNRALGLVGPLTAGIDGSLPASLTIGRARNLLCPLLHLDQQRCAAEDSRGLTSRPGLAARVATIVVQLDLPRPT